MELLAGKYTIVKETIDKDSLGNRIRYGNIIKTIRRNKYRYSVVTPNEIVIYQTWNGGIFGTTKWHLYIFKTSDAKYSSSKIPNVFPKVQLLLFCFGAHRVKKILALVNEIKATRLNLNTLKLSYWVKQNARLQCGKKLLLPT